MTLHEIEETLHTLVRRHPGLDEVMLVTLLRAGGWEEKHIQEACLLFRAGVVSAGEAVDELPALQETPVLAPTVDIDHRLLETNEVPVSEHREEPQSLVTAPSSYSSQESLPHNLPLRPFETSEHIWPFSRYRDVFYGEEEPITSAVGAVPVKQKVEEIIVEKPVEAAPVLIPTPETTPLAAPVVIPQQPVVDAVPLSPQPVVLPPKEQSPSVEVRVVTVPLSGGDEKLVVLASIMLLAILLLLGYMYSNGRL